MDKSQLRRLAIDYAQGHLDYEGYVRERTELIDAIVSGRMPIEREAPRQPKSPLLEEDLDAVADIAQLESGKVLWGLSPLHIFIGGAVIALLAVFFFTDDEPEPALTTDPPKTLLTAVDLLPAFQARKLVEDFVAANSWGTQSLHGFGKAWQSLSESERNDAKAAPWFRPLTTALKQEINAQRAIAGLDDSESTRAKGRRLVSFAKSLGLVGPFPSFESDKAASSSPLARHNAIDESNATTTAERNVVESNTGETDSSASEANLGSSTETGHVETSQSESNPAAPPAATTGTQSAPNTVAITQDNSSSTGTAAKATTSPKPSSTRVSTPSIEAFGSDASIDDSWLAGLSSDSFVLQLFAVKNRAQVDRLLKKHRGHELHVVRIAIGDQHLYRVLQAPFTDETSAKAAFNALPDGLKNGQSEPLIRRVSSVLTGAVAVDSSTAVTTPTPPVQTDETAPDGYTLQLLASDARENVERMLRQYPELALRIHADTNNTSTFRVLYGDFPSADQAKAAIDELPSSLVDAVGGRLMVKSSREPDGDVVTIATRQ